MTDRFLRNLFEHRLFYPNPAIKRRLHLKWWPAVCLALFLARIGWPLVPITLAFVLPWR